MSDMNITDWLTFRPAGVARKARAYIDLPAFSYTAQGTAGDASVIVAQYNFSASSDFYLATRPAKPAGVTYGLCIRWRVGDTVYRYKLWEDEDFNLTDVVQLYNRQRVRANFVLEIWNFPGTASVQGSTIRMITSVRTMPTDLRTVADYALAVGAEYIDAGISLGFTLPSGATHRWSEWQGSSAGNVDSISGVVLTEVGTDATPVQYGAADADLLKGFVRFPTAAAGVDRNYLRANPNLTVNEFTAYCVMRMSDYTKMGGFCWALSTAYGTLSFIRLQANSQSTSGILAASPHITLQYNLGDNTPHIYRIARSGTIMHYSIDDGADIEVSDGLATTVQNLRIEIGSLIGVYDHCDMDIAEVLLFNGSYFASGGDNDVQARNFLMNKHFGTGIASFNIPASFNAGSAWLDNAPL